MRVVVIGGGAAGFFAAIQAACLHSEAEVIILESGQAPLAKVLVSGGGRCNVTHACFSPRELTSFYPRGGKELRGSFHRFGPEHTCEWFAERGVEIVAEADGRMFPKSNSSETIANCLREAAKQAGVRIRLGTAVRGLTHAGGLFTVAFERGELEADAVILATGGSRYGHALASALGHTITDIAPSLFTFVVRDERLTDLAGVSVPHARVQLRVGEDVFEQSGPVLITHWGVSGPAVLKLSAWAARALQQSNYCGVVTLSWVSEDKKMSVEKMRASLVQHAQQHPRQHPSSEALFGLPKRLWQRLLVCAGFPDDVTWAHCRKQQMTALSGELVACPLTVSGKGRFKEEFVTCGGVSNKEINFTTMESKIVPNFYCVGEALDVDALTGGFNFQNAWTTGFIAGSLGT